MTNKELDSVFENQARVLGEFLCKEFRKSNWGWIDPEWFDPNNKGKNAPKVQEILKQTIINVENIVGRYREKIGT